MLKNCNEDSDCISIILPFDAPTCTTLHDHPVQQGVLP